MELKKTTARPSRSAGLAALVFGLASVTLMAAARPNETTEKVVHWSYEGKTGPDEWVGLCHNGIHQSPVDLTGARPKTEEPFQFVNYDSHAPNNCSLFNNGHTVELEMISHVEDALPEVTGGGLPNHFAFAQLHFHWGADDAHGSEHTIGKHAYPMEVHLVHFNTKYGKTIGEAQKNGKNNYDVLAVLAFFFKIVPDDNLELQPVIAALPKVRMETDHIKANCFNIRAFVSDDTSEFYRYNGSLTTPPCSETVIWSVFKKPIAISERQEEHFREILTGDWNHTHHLNNNFRPLQQLNDRVIFEVTTSPEEVEAEAEGEAEVKSEVDADTTTPGTTSTSTVPAPHGNKASTIATSSLLTLLSCLVFLAFEKF